MSKNDPHPSKGAAAKPNCNACGSQLQQVTQPPNSLLNAEQFDAARQGDWFCEYCPKGPSEFSRKHRYFWDRDITGPVKPVVPAKAVEVPGALGETWRPMETAPKDGTLIRLLVEFEHHATEDGEGPHPTIGANTWDNHHDFDEWQFAGWNWDQDCYTQGIGKPVGWLPMMLDRQPAVAADPRGAVLIDLIRDAVGPLEVSAAIIETDDGVEMAALIGRMKLALDAHDTALTAQRGGK